MRSTRQLRLRRRWIIAGILLLIALFPSRVSADATMNEWTCYQSQAEQWVMLQPIEHYNSGYMPNWNDCLAWRDGHPSSDYTWSYGLTASPSTTESITTTSEVSTTTWEATTTSTIPPTTSSTIAQTTTVAVTYPTTTTLPATSTSSTSSTTIALPSAVAPLPETTASTSSTIEQTTTSAEIASTMPASDSSTSSVTTLRSLPIASTTIPELNPATTIPIINEVEEMIKHDEDESAIISQAIANVVSLFAISEDQPITIQKLDEVLQSEAFEQLSIAELEVVSEILSAAEDEVKAEFEEQINVFDGRFDSYVPKGSAISVAQRRVMVVVSAVILTAPTATIGSKKYETKL